MKKLINLIPASGELSSLIMNYGGKLLLALITLIIGLWLIGRFKRLLKKVFEMRSYEKTLQEFLLQLISVTLKVLLLISVISMVGIQMTSFIALLGAAGLAFGMALSGTLQNFAGGVMLLILKPFKVGDYIEAQDYAGTVHEIQIFHTILHTPDKKTIIIPNGPLSNGAAVNFSASPVRRVDWTFGIGYSDNIDKAKQLIQDLLKNDQRILPDPSPFTGIISLGDSSVNIVTRAWVNSGDYWDVFFEINELVKKTFDAQGVSIPFPQRDVHIIQPKQ
ncbi:MAG: mechanosensitive ion channel [Lentimicrobium sp.]|nr:mechanosensitive ion channel [Lentimicrobium sp.]